MALYLGLFPSFYPPLSSLKAAVALKTRSLAALGGDILHLKLLRNSHSHHISTIWPISHLLSKSPTVVTWIDSELFFFEKFYAQGFGESNQQQLFTITAAWGCSASWDKQETGKKNSERSVHWDVPRELWKAVTIRVST